MARICEDDEQREREVGEYFSSRIDPQGRARGLVRPTSPAILRPKSLRNPTHCSPYDIPAPTPRRKNRLIPVFIHSVVSSRKIDHVYENMRERNCSIASTRSRNLYLTGRADESTDYMRIYHPVRMVRASVAVARRP